MEAAGAEAVPRRTNQFMYDHTNYATAGKGKAWVRGPLIKSWFYWHGFESLSCLEASGQLQTLPAFVNEFLSPLVCAVLLEQSITEIDSIHFPASIFKLKSSAPRVPQLTPNL